MTRTSPTVCRVVFGFACLGLVLSGRVLAQANGDKPTAADEQAVLAATKQGLQRLDQAGRNWMKNKTCFSCHHQPLPMFAAVEAARVGIHIEAKVLAAQADFTHDYFHDRIEPMKAGKHVPGGSATAGFGLWALMLDRRPADDTTTATVSYLLQIQGVVALNADATAKPPKRTDGPWVPSCTRPPLNSSRVGTTVLALIGMTHYATDDQRDAVEKAAKLAETWLTKTPMTSTDDRFWRLWGLHRLGGDAPTIKDARAVLTAAQHADGGWSQTKDMGSDAYATGQALYVLRQTGTPCEDPVAQRASAYLIRTQHADGSWLVETRIQAVQPYFDNGDPYEMHQFLSVAATSWATAALAQMLPKVAWCH